MSITTILFDLDDTLLGNDIHKFIQPYFNAFAAHVAGLVDPRAFVDGLVAGTQRMLANRDPRRTMEEVFNERFYDDLGLGNGHLHEAIRSYFAHVFPQLKTETHVIPSARAVVQWAFESGFKVVIATNSLFPRDAILHRLDWAGVGASEFPYHLITTQEFMHFAKPNLEYFAEILALVDSRPEDTIMVGNDWEQDIAPAYAMGIHTWWVADSSTQLRGPASPFGVGSLDVFLEQIRRPEALGALTPRPQIPDAVRADQAASLAAMVGLLKDAAPEQWRLRPGGAEWSLTEIVCHLRDAELEVSLPRLHKVLGEPNPFISAIDSDAWAIGRRYASQSGPEALQTFAQARVESLAVLDRLSPDQWNRPARHAVFGPTTLLELVSFTNQHDRLHLQQMRENLKVPVL